MQKAALSVGGVPLLISTDREGDIVNRIGPPAAVLPGSMALGATFNPDEANRVGAMSGAELRVMAINVATARSST